MSRFGVGVAGWLVGLASVAAQGQLLWSTGVWDQNDARASDQVFDGSKAPNRAADDFTLPQGDGSLYVLSTIRGDMLAVNYFSFVAEVYTNNGGEPATSPLLTIGQKSMAVVATGVFGLYDHVRVEFEVEGVTLAPGTYWISLVGNVGGIGNEGYAFFCTAGDGVVKGSSGFYRGGAQPWKPILFGLGFETDFAFTVEGTQGAAACKPDCEQDGDLDIFDYLCFLGKFSNQDPYADFEGDGDWDIFDFLAFQGAFSLGC